MISSYILGIITGLLFSLIAIVVGKKLDKAVNDPHYTVPHIQNTVKMPQATIIKNKDVIQEFLDDKN